ncbi:type II toxin-antitoxin system RelE/ParE family toxin [Polynucleobacter sp.]|uniref:type II toxin-antitoxin system RelE/ParE family toxin n=1 Tax=Polynucleobacter sp. TaxID=2029855 RepID=UPI0037CA17EE
MVWLIEFAPSAEKQLRKYDPTVAKRIFKFCRERLAVQVDPRILGEALKGSEYGGYWRYRVGDYRIIASIQDEEISILVVSIGDRKHIYK